MAASAETIAIATEKNLKITERPISIKYTEDGSTLHPIVHGFEVMSRIIAMISEKRPLFFFGLGGLFFVLVGTLTGFRAIIIIIEGGGAVNGYTLATLALQFIGALSIFTGIILNVLMKRK